MCTIDPSYAQGTELRAQGVVSGVLPDRPGGGEGRRGSRPLTYRRAALPCVTVPAARRGTPLPRPPDNHGLYHASAGRERGDLGSAEVRGQRSVVSEEPEVSPSTLRHAQGSG